MSDDARIVGTDAIRSAAHAAATVVLTEVQTDDPHHIATMAWLDGFMAGHRSATAYAVQVLGAPSSRKPYDQDDDPPRLEAV